MRRVRFYVVRWLLLFLVVFGVRVPFLWNQDADSIAAAAVGAALVAALLPYVMVKVQKWQSRKGTSVSWRTCPAPGGKPTRWRTGWLRQDGDDVVVGLLTSKTGPRLHPDDVREVADRAVARREWLWISPHARVLEVTTAQGRIDLAVQREDVEDVRRRLGAESASVTSSAPGEPESSPPR